MTIMKHSALSLCIAAGLGMSSIPVLVYAHDAGDWLVRGRIININPNDDNNGVTTDGGGALGPTLGAGTVPGTEVGVEDAWTLDIDITYMITDNWGVELLLDPSTQHDVTAKGATYSALSTLAPVPDIPNGATIIETRVLPPALILQYHFMPHEQIQPYVGLGLNYTIFFDESVTDTLSNSLVGVTDLELENSFGVAAQVGADFIMDNGWFANIDLKYIDISTTAKFNSGALGYSEAEVDINPWVIGVGVGKSF